MEKNNYQVLLGIFVAVLLSAVLYFGIFRQPRSAFEFDSGHQITMGTFARVVAIAPHENIGKKCIEAALEQIELVDRLMSDYKQDSELSLLNKEGFNKDIKLSAPTFEVLQKTVEISKLTGGAFDVTIGPLVDLWRLAGEANSLPNAEELRRAQSKVGYEKLVLDPKNMTARFSVEGMRIDLGAVAKGYAVDKAVDKLQKYGAVGGMVDIGGDIRCFGIVPKGKNIWRIGLQNPNPDSIGFDNKKILLTLEIKDKAVATSGSYQRFSLIDGKIHSHILNQKTGQSSEKLSSVTVICDTAIEADALATAVTVSGRHKGMELIEKLQQVECVLITAGPEFKMLKSSGVEQFIKSPKKN